MKINYKSIDLTIAFCFMAMVGLMYPNTAFALDQDSNQISTVLCNAVKFITGGIGKAIATIALIVVALSLFAGKLSWPTAAMIAVGLGILFGAAGIVNFIAGSGETGGCSA